MTTCVFPRRHFCASRWNIDVEGRLARQATSYALSSSSLLPKLSTSSSRPRLRSTRTRKLASNRCRAWAPTASSRSLSSSTATFASSSTTTRRRTFTTSSARRVARALHTPVPCSFFADCVSRTAGLVRTSRRPRCRSPALRTGTGRRHSAPVATSRSRSQKARTSCRTRPIPTLNSWHSTSTSAWCVALLGNAGEFKSLIGDAVGRH